MRLPIGLVLLAVLFAFLTSGCDKSSTPHTTASSAPPNAGPQKMPNVPPVPPPPPKK